MCLIILLVVGLVAVYLFLKEAFAAICAVFGFLIALIIYLIIRKRSR